MGDVVDGGGVVVEGGVVVDGDGTVDEGDVSVPVPVEDVPGACEEGSVGSVLLGGTLMLPGVVESGVVPFGLGCMVVSPGSVPGCCVVVPAGG